VTMNERQFFESARHLAEQALRQSDRTSEQRLAYLFRKATSRAPAPEETKAILDLYQGNLAEYQANPQAAKQVIADGDTPPDTSLETSELAAWTMVANLILNLDEVMTKH